MYNQSYIVLSTKLLLMIYIIYIVVEWVDPFIKATTNIFDRLTKLL